MSLQSRVLLTVGLAAFFSHAARAEDGPREWIEMLANEKLSLRIAAEKKLWAAGSSAEQELKQAASHSNPEVVLRTEKILRYMLLGLTPESPRELIDLAESFSRTSIEGKKNTLESLKKQRKFRIALLLYQNEKDPAIQRQIRDEVTGLAIVAAREALLAGDAEGALKFLKDFPEDPKNTFALAWTARTAGRLDEEIAAAAKAGDNQQWRYHLALLRIKGNRHDAAALAEQHNLPKLAAALELLDGHPETWMSLYSSKNEETRDIVETYAEIARFRLQQGKEAPAALMNKLIKTSLKDGNYSKRWAATSALFAVGNNEAGEKALKNLNPMILFQQLVEREQIDEALKSIGLDPDKPDYEKWLAQRMTGIQGNQENDELNDVSIMLSFMEKRGLWEPIQKSFVADVLELADKKNDAFLELLANCFSPYATTRVAPEVAMQIAVAYAKDDEVLWGAMIRAAFSDNTSFTQWWEWLGELSPKASKAERFRQLLVIFRAIPDHKNELQGIEDSITACMKTAPKEQLAAYRTLLNVLSAITRQTRYAQWAVSDESELDTDDLMNLGRWDAAADKWSASTKTNPDQIIAQLWASVCQRMAGNTVEADKREKLFESLVYGDSAVMMAAASIYNYVGMTSKSQEWRKMALDCGNQDSSWHLSLYLEAEDLVLQGEWAQALSGYEAYILSTIDDDEGGTNINSFRTRKKADMARGFSFIKNKPQLAFKILDDCHKSLLADASLADQFFPALRLCGAIKQHDQWFEESWAAMMKLRDKYPMDDNIRNSAAWLAARSIRRLDDAEKESLEALRLRPNQAAYLDTMAEIWFARGNREKAIEWSAKSIQSEPGTSALREQYYRFKDGEFPQ